jgi:hypothetical protein
MDIAAYYQGRSGAGIAQGLRSMNALGPVLQHVIENTPKGYALAELAQSQQPPTNTEITSVINQRGVKISTQVAINVKTKVVNGSNVHPTYLNPLSIGQLMLTKSKPKGLTNQQNVSNGDDVSSNRSLGQRLG